MLHLYTADHGRVGAVAKGVRRVKSRLGGRLEPLSRVQLVLHQGRGELCTISQADTVHAHPGAARAPRVARARHAGVRGGAAAARLERAQPARLQPALQRAGAARRRSCARLPVSGARLPAQAAPGRRLRARARLVRVRAGTPSTSAASRRAQAGWCAQAARRARSRSARTPTASSSRRWRARCRRRRRPEPRARPGRPCRGGDARAPCARAIEARGLGKYSPSP